MVSNMRQGHSLFQQLLKLASLSISSFKSSSKHCSPHAKVLKELFIVLTNCVVSQECRTTFKKVIYFPNSQSLSVCLSIGLYSVCLSVSLLVYVLSVCLSVSLLVYILSVCLSIGLCSLSFM